MTEVGKVCPLWISLIVVVPFTERGEPLTLAKRGSTTFSDGASWGLHDCRILSQVDEFSKVAAAPVSTRK